MLEQILSALAELGLDRSEALRALMSEEDTLALVKLLLGIPADDDSEDALLQFVIQTVEGMILKYINHDTLPEPLHNVLAVMCVSYYKAAGLGSDESTTGPVSSVRRGDVTTSFTTASGASGSAQTFNLGTDSGDFFGWKTVLNEWRKLGW